MSYDKVSELKEEIKLEINNLSSNLLLPISNQQIYAQRLERNLKFIKWVNKKFKISTSRRKYTVAQKEVYHCDLGVNVGSEQGEIRPVVVLQNNFGNRSGNTTIVAPITSHENSVQFDNENGKFYIDILQENGKVHKKYLDYYEIPIILNSNSERKIYGFVNVAHIREIDRKRICSSKIATITDECFINIKRAISKNLR